MYNYKPLNLCNYKYSKNPLCHCHNEKAIISLQKHFRKQNSVSLPAYLICPSLTKIVPYLQQVNWSSVGSKLQEFLRKKSIALITPWN